MAGTTTKRQKGGDQEMSWVSRKLFLYNVTVGLYVMDWWERYLFSILSSFISSYLCCPLDLFPMQSVLCMFFFLEYVGRLHIIALRRK